MLTHPACSPVSPRGRPKCPEKVAYAQFGALEPRKENVLDGGEEILILGGKSMCLDFVIVSSCTLRELIVWRHLHQMELLQ